MDLSHYFREQMGVKTSGWLYHPAMLDFRIGLQPEWNQVIERHGDEKSKSASLYLTGYDFDAVFLRRRPVTFSFFAQRRMSPLGRAYA